MSLLFNLLAFLMLAVLPPFIGKPKQAHTKTKIVLYRPHKGQIPIHRSKARFRVVACGRRFGKTLMACNELVKFALEHPQSNCAWVAPWFRQSKVAYRLIRRAISRSQGILANKSDTDLRLEFTNGSVIQFFSAENHNNIRSEGYHFVVIDEAGDALADPEVWEKSIRPALSDTNGKALIIGTPKGRNLFFRLFAKGIDTLDTEWESFHAPTSANPYIPTKEIEQAKQDIPEDAFEQEYLARFLEEAAGVFKGVDRCIKGLLDPEYQRVKSHFYVVGWDVAKYKDYSVITVIDCHTRRVVAWKRINQIDYSVQVEMVSRIAQEFCATVYMDVTGVGDAPAEYLRMEASKRGFQVEEYLFTNASKKILVEKLQIAIQNGDIELPDIPVLVNELKIYEYRMTPSRNITYSAPKGAHDDAATSLMLANYGMSQPRGPLIWSVDTDKPIRTLEMPELPENQHEYAVMQIEHYENDEGEWIDYE